MAADDLYHDVFVHALVWELLRHSRLNLVVFNTVQEEIVEWKK